MSEVIQEVEKIGGGTAGAETKTLLYSKTSNSQNWDVNDSVNIDISSYNKLYLLVTKASAVKISEYVDLDYFKTNTSQHYISPAYYTGTNTNISVFIYVVNKVTTTIIITGKWDSSNLWECYIYGIK